MKFTPVHLAAGVARRLKRWADQKQIGKVDKEIFKHTDCLATVQAVNKYLRPVRLCDIGANAGHWSYVMHQLNPQLQDVVMIEPQAKLISGLHDLKLPGTIRHVYSCALGEKRHVMTLSGGTASASLFEAGNNQHHFFPGSTNQDSEQVEVRVLDEIYKADNLVYPEANFRMKCNFE